MLDRVGRALWRMLRGLMICAPIAAAGLSPLLRRIWRPGRTAEGQ